MTDKIIKALRLGTPISRISKELEIPERTIWWRIKHNKEYKQAWEHHKTLIDNIFK